MVHKLFLLGNPVGVLHQVSLVEPRPVLGLEVARQVVAAVVLHALPVTTSGEEIQSIERVVVLTLSNHILLADVGQCIVEVQSQLVIAELGGVAEVEVVAVEVVVVDKTCRVGGTH